MTKVGPICIFQLTRKTYRDSECNGQETRDSSELCPGGGGPCVCPGSAVPATLRWRAQKGRLVAPCSHFGRVMGGERKQTCAVSNFRFGTNETKWPPRPALSAKLCFSVKQLDELVVPGDRCLCRDHADQAPGLDETPA